MNNLAFALSSSSNARDLDEALNLAQKALQISPNEPELIDTLGWIWLKKGKPDTALQLFEPISQANPGNPSYKHHVGLALLAKGDRSDGERTLQAALLKGPSRVEADEIRETLEQSRGK
jgi:Flp pilus assembly protein TadD